MKILIIPDIHNEIAIANRIINQEDDADQIIFLGDFFDSYGDSDYMATDTAKWLKDKISDPKYVCLIGNHDWCYINESQGGSFCTGYAPEKNDAIRSILCQEELEQLKFCHYNKSYNILFSHAGISSHLIDVMINNGFTIPELKTGQDYSDFITHEIPNIYKWTRTTRNGHPLMGAGISRGGDQMIGGIIWADFSEHTPVEELIQIIGHTPHRNPDLALMNRDDEHFNAAVTYKGLEDFHFQQGWTLDIDTHLREYAVIENDILQVKRTHDKTIIFQRKLT